MRNLFIFLALVGGAALSRGQSINVDLDTSAPPQGGGGVPSDSFAGAALQPGRWNSVYVIGHADQLYGLDRALTSVSLSIASSNEGISGGAHANPSNTGDFAKLLNDAANVDDVWRSWTFHGLTTGTYRVTTYAVKPSPFFTEAFVSVNGGLIAQSAGVMPGNQFILGVTHVVQNTEVNDGNLEIHVSRNSNGNIANVNGFQITQVVPEPNSILLLSVAFGGVFLRKRNNP